MSNFKTWLKILNLLEDIRAPHGDPADMLKALPDDKFRLAVLGAAMTMQMVRDEAIRRGIWDDIKSIKVKASDGSQK